MAQVLFPALNDSVWVCGKIKQELVVKLDAKVGNVRKSQMPMASKLLVLVFSGYPGNVEPS